MVTICEYKKGGTNSRAATSDKGVMGLLKLPPIIPKEREEDHIDISLIDIKLFLEPSFRCKPQLVFVKPDRWSVACADAGCYLP